jgi:hypothetical protein
MSPIRDLIGAILISVLAFTTGYDCGHRPAPLVTPQQQEVDALHRRLDQADERIRDMADRIALECRTSRVGVTP